MTVYHLRQMFAMRAVFDTCEEQHRDLTGTSQVRSPRCEIVERLITLQLFQEPVQAFSLQLLAFPLLA